MVEISRSIEKYYKDYAVYMKPPSGKGFILYKPKGVPIEAIRIKEKRHPENLYITLQDKIREITFYQRQFNRRLRTAVRDDPFLAKQILQKNLEMSLSEPRIQVLKNMKETVDIVVGEYLETPGVVKRLIEVSTKDYSTSVHSINVMLFCLGYASYCRQSIEEMKQFGLMGLLHDVGKTRVPVDVLKAESPLSTKEDKLMKQHPEHGYRILSESRFDTKIALVALEHHERLDGSGYPDGKTADEISPDAKSLGMIDAFETYTAPAPEREPLKPIKALAMIMEEVEKGEFDLGMFKQFAHSVVGMQ